MHAPAVICTGIEKKFEHTVIPSKMLQDHVIRWKSHRKRWSLQALSNISFTVKKGEWVGLYGSNGSGKTTLLRVLAGLLPADAGSISIEGKLTCFFELGVGFHPERSAVENIYLHGLIHGMDTSTIEALTEEIIERAGVRSHRDLPVKCYSTGMRLRLAFMTMMRTEADVYFLDEILAVGDKAFQKICREELCALKQKGKTVLLVHHGFPELRSYCDRILCMDQGKIKEELLTSTLTSDEHEPMR